MAAGHAAHDHAGHSHAHAGTNAPARLWLALALTAAVALLEFCGGLAAHSLALMSDAAHVAMDVVALGIALAAQVQSVRPATVQQTFGFARMEVIAALVNGGLLLGVTILIAVEAARRFAHPERPEGQVMILIAGIGLAVNLSVGLILAASAKSNLNVRAALMHVFGDAIGALAVVAGGVAISLYAVPWLDPLLSLLVAAIIVAGVFGIMRDAVNVLLESAPANAAVPHVRERMLEVPGVAGVHDLHVWQIGTQSCALTAHVLLEDAMISKATAILNAVDARLRDQFGITHVTIQFECVACHPDDSIVCTQVSQT